MNGLDFTDKRILFELDVNSRISVNDLAKKTRLSRDVVAYRMKKLEELGMIEKYISIIDFSRFGYRIIRLYLKLQKLDANAKKSLIDFLVRRDDVMTVYESDGHFDIAVGFLVRDLRDFQNIYGELMKKYKPYISEVNTGVFLDYLHYNRNYLVEKKIQDNRFISTGSFEQFKPDRKDVELLELIKENSRVSLVELAGKLKMTATGVKYKLSNLEREKVILGYKILVDISKLGYEYFKVDLQLEDYNVLEEISAFILTNPNVIYRNIVVGGSDFEFDCEFESVEKFYAFIGELQMKFPKKIRSYSYYRAVKIYKYSYLPKNFILGKSKV